jgi:hypothetical protein
MNPYLNNALQPQLAEIGRQYDITGTQPYRVTATTSFTIKGWMFKTSNNIVKKIYTIDSKYLLMGSNGDLENDKQEVQPSLLQDFSDFYSNYINISELNK